MPDYSSEVAMISQQQDHFLLVAAGPVDPVAIGAAAEVFVFSKFAESEGTCCQVVLRQVGHGSDLKIKAATFNHPSKKAGATGATSIDPFPTDLFQSGQYLKGTVNVNPDRHKGEFFNVNNQPNKQH
jgi:hypothetical protein